MLLDVRPNDQALEIEIDLQTVNWFNLMRVLQSNYLEINDTIIQAANRNINTSGLKTKRQQKAYKNLVINGGRGIYDLNAMPFQNREDIAIKYAIDAKCKNICVYSVFQQMEKWEQTFLDSNFSVFNIDIIRDDRDSAIDPNAVGSVIITAMIDKIAMKEVDGFTFDFIIYDIPLEGAVLDLPSLDSLFSNLIFMPINTNDRSLRTFVTEFSWNKDQQKEIQNKLSENNNKLSKNNDLLEYQNLFKKIRLTI